MAYTDERGKRQRKSTGTRLKSNAEKILYKAETDSAEIQAGLKTRASDDLKASISDVVKEYFDELKTKKTLKYAKSCRREITDCANHLGWLILQDVDADGLAKYVTHLQSEGRGARTRHSVITAVRTFCNWCITKGKLAANPVAAKKIDKPSLQSREYKRRMLTHEEWKELSKYLQNSSKVHRGQSPAERRLEYWLAIETGYRASEIRSLTKNKLKSVADAPCVLCDGEHTKNGKDARQFISDALAKALKKHLRGHKATDPIFNVPEKTALILHKDLIAAREAWVKEAGEEAAKEAPYFLAQKNSEDEIMDFHALRHTCGAWYVLAGVSLPEVQHIMRHSSITLTIDTYGHLAPGAESKHRNLLTAVLA